MISIFRGRDSAGILPGAALTLSHFFSRQG
jgi:hypothetical protein